MPPAEYEKLQLDQAAAGTAVKAEAVESGNNKQSNQGLLPVKREQLSEDEDKPDGLDLSGNFVDISFDMFSRNRKSEIHTRHVVKKYRATYTKAFIANDLKAYPYGFRFTVKKNE